MEGWSEGGMEGRGGMEARGGDRRNGGVEGWREGGEGMGKDDGSFP